MASVKVAISLPEALFEQLEAAAAEAQLPRSHLIAEAVGEYLNRRRIAELRERIREAYADGGLDADDRATLDAMAKLMRETLPPENG